MDPATPLHPASPAPVSDPAGTILAFPRPPRVFLWRERLERRLDTLAPLTVLRAPAGYGKTVLAGTWARARAAAALPTAWLSVPAGASADDLWVGALAALRRAVVPWGPSLGDNDNDNDNGPDAALSPFQRLSRTARDLASPTVLVVDDLHHVEVSGADEGLVRLATDAPMLHLVLVTRVRRPVEAQAVLRVDAQVLDRDDLELTEQETAALVQLLDDARPGSQPDDERAAAQHLHRLVGGWPAAVRVAVGVSPEQLDERVRDFLQTVLHDPQLRWFATSVSLARQVSVDSAAAMTQLPDAHRLLLDLERAGLLSSSPGTGGGLLTFPEPIRRVLQHEARRARPGEVALLHGRLARWHRDQGESAAAVEHGAQAADWDLVAHVVQADWAALLMHHPDTVRTALASVPASYTALNPHLRVMREAVAMVPQDLHEPQVPAQDDDRVGEFQRLVQRAAWDEALSVGVGHVVALRRAGQFREALPLLDRLASVADVMARERPQIRPALSMAWLQWGIGRMLATDLPGAARDLRRAYRTPAEGELAWLPRNAANNIALLYALDGDPVHTDDWRTRALEHPEPGSWLDGPVATSARAAQALAAVDRLDEQGAAAALALAGDPTGTDELWPFVVFARARYALVWGDRLDMLRQLELVHQVQQRLTGPGSVAELLLALARTELLLADGQANQAARALAGLRGRHPGVSGALARVRLLSGDVSGALEQAAEAVWGFPALGPDQGGRLTQAAAQLRTGRTEQAVTTFGQVVVAARRTGSLRLFRSVPVADLDALTALVPAAADLTQGALVQGVPPTYPATVELVSLTEREAAVLGHLPGPFSSEQIARTLFVSTNTVKSQLRAVYRKLGVSSRAAAVARATELGLLERR